MAYKNGFDKFLSLINLKLALTSQTRDEFFSANNSFPQWEETLIENFRTLLDFPEFEISDIINTKQKCETDSVKERQLGNDQMKKSAFNSAVYAYTHSIALAPTSSPALAFSYANRGVVLKAMEHFEDSILDTQRALALDYPEQLKHKLYNRLGHCFHQLGKIEEAKKYFAKALSAIDNATALPDTEKNDLKKKNKHDLEMCEESFGKLKIRGSDFQQFPTIYGLPEVSPAPLPNLSKGSSLESKCLSKKVAISYTKTLGRHLVAATDIKPGDVLLVEKMNSFLLKDKFTWSHCSHCMMRCRTLLPCSQCAWSMFCSVECMAAAQQYHQIECGVMPFVKSYFSQHFVLALKLLAASDIKELEKLADEVKIVYPKSDEDWRTVGCDKDGKLPSGIAGIFSFYYDKKWNSIKLMYSCIFTLTVTKILRLEKVESRLKLEAFILKLTHSISNMTCSSMVELELNLEICRFRMTGWHAAPTFILIGNSCNPNVAPHQYKTTVVVRAIQPIPKGHKLCMSYGRAFLKHPKNVRQSFLYSENGFMCDCEACYGDWPMLEDLPAGPSFQLPLENKAMESITVELQFLLDKHHDGNKFVVTKTSLPVFLKYIMMMSKHNKTLNKRYFDIVEEVKFYFALQGNLYLNLYELLE